MAVRTIRKREEIPAEYKWNLEDLFASDELWEQECEKLQQLCMQIKEFEGTLGQSAEQLYVFFQKADELAYYEGRICVYANEKYHQDTTVAKYQGYASLSDSILAQAAQSISFAEPEILQLSLEQIEQFYKEKPELESYRRCIEEMMRQKAHTRSAEVEELLASVQEFASTPGTIFSMYNNADIHIHSILDVEGNRIRITHGNFGLLLKSKDGRLRKNAFTSMYHAYEKMGNTIAAMFIANLKQEAFFAKSRRYDSVRKMHMDAGNIPELVYDQLIETVHKYLPALHRYVSYRKKKMGVDRLHMYDLYLPLAEDPCITYPFEEAKDLVIRALAPMGEEYVEILKKGFSEGWIDVYENENKRSGAYSWAAYGTHPYVLLNHQDDLDSVFTIAHEMGHAMHTYYSNQTQPITYSDYRIFVAEVASTCNESLLCQYMLEHAEDDRQKEYIMNHYLESFRTTLFRQAMFAEFEHIAHTKLAEGEALTQEMLCDIYHDLNVAYYGPDIVVDEEIDYEWMRIPHFYTAYYVYQYATGYSAAIACADKIRKEGAPAAEAYIKNFLSGGSAKDPLDLLLGAGVDMSTPEPVEAALRVFEKCLDEFCS